MPRVFQRVAIFAALVKGAQPELAYHAFYHAFYAFDEGQFPAASEVDDDSLVLVSGTAGAGPSPMVAKLISVFDHAHNCPSYTSVGSRVYVVGGDHDLCDKCVRAYKFDEHKYNDDDVKIRTLAERSVYVLDTTRGKESEWSNLPLMTCGRWSPHLHVLDGALYAMGGEKWGLDYANLETFMEVLLPNPGSEWTPLPNPPEPFTSKSMQFDNFVSALVTDETGRRDPYFLFIFGRGYDGFCTYTPKHETWAIEDTPAPGFSPFYPFNPFGRGVVYRGHYIFLYDDGLLDRRLLVCYNIDLGGYLVLDTRYEGLVPFGTIHTVSVYEMELVDVGNNELAVLWSDYCDLTLDSAGYWYCKFTIDFRRARLGHKCCSVVSNGRCIGPNAPMNGAFTLDLPANFRKGRHYNERHHVSTRKLILEPEVDKKRLKLGSAEESRLGEKGERAKQS